MPMYTSQDALLINLRQELGNVTDIMKSNMQKLLIRGDKLAVLEEKAEDLARQAEIFNKKSKKLRKAMWWKNAKFYMVGSVVVVVLVTGVILIIAL